MVNEVTILPMWHTQLQITKKYAKFSQNIYKFGNFAIITKRCFVRFPPKITIEVASSWNFFSSATDYLQIQLLQMQILSASKLF